MTYADPTYDPLYEEPAARTSHLASKVTPQEQACKFDYEYLGKSTATLVQQYDLDVTPDELQAYADEHGWQRKVQATTLPETKDLQEYASALADTTRAKLSVIALWRQIENQPLYAALEKQILDQTTTMVASLDPYDTESNVHTKLKAAVDILQKIQDRNPVQLSKQLEEQLQEGGVVVQILNQVGTDSQQATPAEPTTR